MKKIRLFLLILFLSCSFDRSETVNFEILNKSELSVKLIQISNGQNKLFLNRKLNLDEKVNCKLKFTDSITKGDGNYYLKYIFKGDTIEKYFGYFTNGYPLSDHYDISIYKDSIAVKELAK